jgi:hypothetical protein
MRMLSRNAFAAWPAQVLASVGAIGLLLMAFTSQARALGPNSPKVKQAIANAIKFLETAEDGRIGAQALIGMTLLKNGADPTHPKVQAAVNVVAGAAKVLPEQYHHDIYSTGLSIMLLVAVDPVKYRSEIATICSSLRLRQKDHGAWGYPKEDKNNGKTCDTSQTQYAVLGLWEAEDLAGVPTPPEIWDKVAEWLIRTQQSDGAFAYQGNPSDAIGERIAQPGASHNMTAAAMGSLYIVKDRLGIRKLRKGADDDTPEVLVPYESAEDIKNRIKTKIELKYFTRAISSGNTWFDDRTIPLEKPATPSFIYYYLYARERYESLREADEKGSVKVDLQSENAADWYEQGARFLIDTQKENGAWESACGAVPDTCFGALFLLRSTKKTLEKRDELRRQAGLMLAGRGLPADPNVRVREGKVTVRPLAGNIDQVLAAVDDERNPAHAQAIEALADLSRSGDRAELARHGRDLARLAVAGETEVRLIAIAAIERSRNLDIAPVLIQLLSDPDLDVTRAASESLGRISRKYTTFGLGVEPTAEQRAKAIAGWRAWYKSIRPDVDLDSYDPLAEAP